jgi:hypothetical protein
LFVRDRHIEGIERDGTDVPIRKHEICDFCPGLNPIRVFRAWDCIVPWKSGNGINHLSEGGWAACATCAELVDGEKWAELTARSVREFCAKHFVFDVRAIAEVRGEVTRSHALFRRHRIEDVVRKRKAGV